MSTVRQPAVAGAFYPGDAETLALEVASLLQEAEQSAAADAPMPKAVIVPHAGYVYSGPVAASAYARLRAARGRVRRVVLLGPCHRVAVRGLALPDVAEFATPLGRVPVDRDAAVALQDLRQVTVSAQAHAFEHSLEVQLPFLQAVLGDFALLPLAVGDATAEEVAAVLERLWGDTETLIVISSDLSHYLPYDVAKRVDAVTARAIMAMQHTIDHSQACGATPVDGFLLAAKRRGLAPELLDLRNSGDTAGDRSRVVGYAAFAFSERGAHVH